jgi:hypothetical protein
MGYDENIESRNDLLPCFENKRKPDHEKRGGKCRNFLKLSPRKRIFLGTANIFEKVVKLIIKMRNNNR